MTKLTQLPPNIFVDDPNVDPLLEEPAEKPKPRRAARLQRFPHLFVRVPLSWITKPPRPHVFGPESRLFLYVLFRSHWGQRGVKLTSAVAAEVGVTRCFKNRCVNRWEADGWVRVEREGKGSPTLWPIVIAG